jgi:uncharacterized membrane protein YjgN (DUF898 family)
MLTVLSGALAGTVHVLSGPDHLAAVAPLAVSGRRRGWVSGWTWGLGHSSGVVMVGALAVLLRDLLPPLDAISSWSEKLVGGALIVVGLWALRRGLRIGTATHAHDGVQHEHVHVRSGPAVARRLGHAHAAFWMGVLHGLAGSSHVLGVVPALALPTRAAAFSYLAAFGVATVLAMTAFAAIVGVAGQRSRLSGAAAHRALVLATAVMAIAVGGFWIVA